MKNESIDEKKEIKKLVEFLVSKRKSKGLTQKDLAIETGITQPTLARIESFNVVPALETLYKISDKLGFNLSLTPKSSSITDILNMDKEVNLNGSCSVEFLVDLEDKYYNEVLNIFSEVLVGVDFTFCIQKAKDKNYKFDIFDDKGVYNDFRFTGKGIMKNSQYFSLIHKLQKVLDTIYFNTPIYNVRHDERVVETEKNSSLFVEVIQHGKVIRKLQNLKVGDFIIPFPQLKGDPKEYEYVDVSTEPKEVTKIDYKNQEIFYLDGKIMDKMLKKEKKISFRRVYVEL